MEMKEFHYEDGLRVSVFNLDHRSVPYHHHDAVSDMVYCAKGQITIELLDSGEAYRIEPGQVFQVPCSKKHRFVNSAPEGVAARYVLLQIGEFNIHFASKEHAGEKAKRLSVTEAISTPNETVYIGDRKEDILALASRFEQHKPDALTVDERDDVVDALRVLGTKGVNGKHPAAIV